MPTNRQRREAERRRLERQLHRRAEREARRRRFALVASIAGALAVAGIVIGFVMATGAEDSSTAGQSPTPSSSVPTSSASSSASSSPAAAYPCTWATKLPPVKQGIKKPPTTRPPRSGSVKVAVQTTRGAMTFTLNRAAAPCAVESFVSLATQHFFDHTPCHRLTTTDTLGVLQCGDPSGTGRGAPGYSFNDELTGHEKYIRGVIGMANGGPNTNGSQFFIVYKNSQLQPNFTIFGRVTAGLGVVDKVAAKGANSSDGKPKLPINLVKVSIVK
jgi:peptidyl-prolyl cis-trans isomerase B (cyclophilin B)